MSPSNAVAVQGHEAIDEAVACFRRSDYARCLDLLKAARVMNPDLFPARVILAQLFLLDNRHAQAREALEQAAVEEPTCPEIPILLGRLALEDGRAKEASGLFEKALALAGTGTWPEGSRKAFRSEARAGLAAAAESRGDWHAAEASLSAWLELEPRNGRARGRLARARFRQGRRENVFEELRQAAQDDDTLDPPAIIMARLHVEAGESGEAAGWVERAVEAAPRDPRVHLAAAFWYLDQDRPERARDLAEAAARLDPGSAAIKGARALIAWHLKDYPEAERLCQEFSNESPGNLGASQLWALALAEQPSEAKRRRALGLAEADVRKDRNSGEALTTLGWVYYRNGRPDDAERTLRAALASGPVGSEAPYYLARVLSARGRDAEATPLLKLSLDAPGRFAFRKEAREWLAKLAR